MVNLTIKSGSIMNPKDVSEVSASDVKDLSQKLAAIIANIALTANVKVHYVRFQGCKDGVMVDFGSYYDFIAIMGVRVQRSNEEFGKMELYLVAPDGEMLCDLISLNQSIMFNIQMETQKLKNSKK